MRQGALTCWLALGGFLLPGAGFAQDISASAVGGAAALSTPQHDAAAPDADTSEFWRKVNLDPALLDTPAKPLKAPRSLFESKSMEVKRSDHPDGTASISINKPLPTAWDAKVGSDLGFTDMRTSRFNATQPMPAITDQQSRAVWASVAVPDVASINTRVDSSQDQGKLGASVQRSVPLGERFSVSVQDTYSVTEAYGVPEVTSPVPLASAPVASTATPPLPQIWGNDRQVKLSVLPTGTTFGAGWTNTTGDPVTHNTFSADQKIYGALHVTTSVTDIGQPTASKSVTAGFKMNW